MLISALSFVYLVPNLKADHHLKNAPLLQKCCRAIVCIQGKKGEMSFSFWSGNTGENARRVLIRALAAFFHSPGVPRCCPYLGTPRTAPSLCLGAHCRIFS